MIGFHFYQDAAQLWRWRLLDGDYRIVANSTEDYHQKTDCEQGARLFQNFGSNAPVRKADEFNTKGQGYEWHYYSDNNGQWRWRFQANNNRIIADSAESYVSEYDVKRAAVNVSRVLRVTEKTEKTSHDVRLLRSIRLQNILSFGPDTPELELRELNVLIGPNGSGKSNFLDCIGLLQSAPDKLANTVRTEGSVQAWLWKGTKHPTARVEAIIAPLEKYRPALRHWFKFREAASRFELVEERIEAAEIPKDGSRAKPFLYFGSEGGRTMLNVNMTDLEGPASGKNKPKIMKKRALRKEEINPELSILSQRKDIHFYPELTYLGEQYGQIRLYRDWVFGRNNPARRPQPADVIGDYPREGGENLALVLNQLRREPEAKARLVELLYELYDGIDDYETIAQGGYVELFLREGKNLIPATRLSDGTLRFLYLAAILLDPNPAPLICLEEPELGLHPDVIVALGRLIKETSERTQLIITTHSRVLLDTLSATPEDVIVCSKHDGTTTLQRLEADKLHAYLEEYSLGALWNSGDIGGNRW